MKDTDTKELLARIGLEFLQLSGGYWASVMQNHITELQQSLSNGHVIEAKPIKRKNGSIPKALLEIAAEAGETQQQQTAKKEKLYTVKEAAEKAGVSTTAFVKRAMGLGIEPVKRPAKAADGRTHHMHHYTGQQVQQVYDAMSLAARRLAEHYRNLTPAQKRARNKKLYEGRLKAAAEKEAAA